MYRQRYSPRSLARARKDTYKLIPGRSRRFYETITLLEWAGEKLLSLGTSSPKPRGYATLWPIFVYNPREAYGYTESKTRPPAPSSFQISVMDQILLWLTVIEDYKTRRTVALGLLINPHTQRNQLSFENIARIVGINPDQILMLYEAGINQIIASLAAETISDTLVLLELHAKLSRRPRPAMALDNDTTPLSA